MFKRKGLKKLCIICGSEFEVEAPCQKTCSEKCKRINMKRTDRKGKNVRNKKYRSEHKSYWIDYYRKHKLELIEFMGGECVHCGLKPEDVDDCLGVFVVDEIIPIGRKRKFNNLSKVHLVNAKKLFREDKTQLLCQNCSAIKTWKNGDFGRKSSSTD